MLDKRGHFRRRTVVLALIAVSLGVAVYAGRGLVEQFGGRITGTVSEGPINGSTETSELREADGVNGRSNWFMYQRRFPFDKVPDGARRLAWNDVASWGQGFGPEGAGTTWNSIGPTPTAGGGPGGNVSGRINQIAISPANNQIILVAGSTGGIWRSTNGGTTFVPVSDSQVDVAVGAIAFAPSDSNIVYAGMGDTDNGYFGTGVLKSTDAGATWARVSNATLPDKVRATGIRVNLTDPNKVYLSVATILDPLNCPDRPSCGEIGGLYISTDAGVSWTRALTGIASDVATHPTNPLIVYAAMRYGADNAAVRGLFKSADGGTTWNNVFASPYTGGTGATKDFRVSVTPAAPERVYIYFGSSDNAGPSQLQLQMSTDAGVTWTTRPVVPNTAAGLDMGQFAYNTYLKVSPVNADTVWVGCRDFFRSTDAGVTFTNMNGSFQPPYPNGAFTEAQQKVHTDQQAFTFLPGSDTTFFVGNDGGIFKTTDSGATFTSLNATLSLTQFIGIALDPVNGNLSYGGAQDNGTQRRTAGTNGWVEFILTGDGGKFAINPTNTATLYAGATNGGIQRFLNNVAGEIANAATFGATQNPPRIDFYAPVVTNGVDNRLYSGSWRLYICTDCDTAANPNWTLPSTTDLTTGGTDTLKSIAVSRSNNSVIYTGSGNGRAMRSTDNGVNWTDISAGLPTRSITNITVSATDPTLVYLTVSGYGSPHVFKSVNSGTTWTSINNNLPDIPTNAFLIHPQTPSMLFVGTDIGVFRSTDTGTTWQPFNTGLPPTAVMEFASQANGKIQLTTYGRGAYELGVAAPTTTKRSDFDGDGRTDFSIFRPSEGNWYLNRSTAGFTANHFGTATDRIVMGDFDGDRKADLAVWRPSDVTGVADFYVLRSTDSTVTGVAWGTTADVPVVADYDGDGKDDYAVWRPATGDFYVLQSQSGNLRHYNFGTNGDKPVPADYDGDGKADFAVFRPSTGNWYIARSIDNAVTVTHWGLATDIPVYADYDGDQKTDIAVFRPSDGIWYILKSGGGTSYIPFGTNGDIPVPGDYDGDGKTDQAVYRNGTWYVNNSTSGFATAAFGLASDTPTPRNYLPQ